MSNYSNSYSRGYRRTPNYRRTKSYGFGNFNSTRQRYTGNPKLGGYRRTGRPSYAMVGFSRDTEKKYHDRALASESTAVVTGGPDDGAGRYSRGVMWQSGAWGPYDFHGTNSTSTKLVADLLKGLNTGTTIKARIGNKITPKYLKGSITFTAAVVESDETNKENNNQHGEQVVPDPSDPDEVTGQYVRTTFRVCIVKDLQVNSTNSFIGWDDVFESAGDNTAMNGQTGGVHAEISLKNMGRFIVLYDKYFTLDADDPQKTCPFQISGSAIGNVRYNGPDGDSYTDKGIYVVWAAYTTGFNSILSPSVGESTVMPKPSLNSRLCFTDA